MIKKYLLVALSLFISLGSFAQGNGDKPEMADALMQSGKIYVVVTVLAIIFIGIVVYLVALDRKIARIEKTVGK